MAARPRVFVLNWNPRGWMGEAFQPTAAATGVGDHFELVLYAPLHDAEELLGDLCRSVLDIAVSQELLLVASGYAQRRARARVPDLLAAVSALSAIVLRHIPAGGERHRRLRAMTARG